MKTYSAASADVMGTIQRMREAHHSQELDGLKGVEIAALFVFDSESSEPVLTHQGYPALATVRITPTRDRALGVADAVILIDRAHWQTMAAAQRDAVIDHELTHLERVVDEEAKQPVFDAVMRPKLALRRHDHQLGWFDEVAQRHGEASPEIRQAKALIESSGQLYLPFTQPAAGGKDHGAGVSGRVTRGAARALGTSKGKGAAEARAH